MRIGIAFALAVALTACSRDEIAGDADEGEVANAAAALESKADEVVRQQIVEIEASGANEKGN